MIENMPEIMLDAEKNHFEISGRSIPENANTIFLPVLEWLNQYFMNPENQTNFILKLDYINSSSLKKITEILGLLEKHHNKGCDIKVLWFYKINDTAMESKCRELLSLFNIPSEINPF
jgi:hypothetical protein